MGLDKRMKKRIQQIDKNLDAIVKNPYEKEHIVEKKESRFPLWAKWAIPFGSVALACSLTLAIVLPTANKNNAVGPAGWESTAHEPTESAAKGTSNPHQMGGDNDSSTKAEPGKSTPDSTPDLCESVVPLQDYNMLAPAAVNKYSNDPTLAMSETTYNSYTAFAKKFSSLMIQLGNANGEKSLGVSIPDAYLCFAIMGIISDQAGCNDVLSYLELSSVDELKAASREIVATLGTLSKSYGYNNKYIGGYNLNSIWLDPDQVTLLDGDDKDEDLYDDLATVFDVSLINEGLEKDKANKYLRDYAPDGAPIPVVDLDDDAPALGVMSAFFYMDLLRDIDIYQNQYEQGNHFMNYTFGGTTKSVDYVHYSDFSGQYLEGNGFPAAAIDMRLGGIYFYLPDDDTAMPSTILQDVLDQNFSPVTIPSESGEYERSNYPLDVEAPYFKMNNGLLLNETPLQTILPHLSAGGMGSRLIDQNNVFLSAILQFSTMSFDYRGFYSASVTIATGDTSVGGPELTFTVDHPFVFETRYRVTVNGSYLTVPVVIGEVVDPAYPAYQAS